MDLNEVFCYLIDNDNGFDNQLLADKCEEATNNFAISFLEFALDEFEVDKSNYSLNKKDLLNIFKSKYNV